MANAKAKNQKNKEKEPWFQRCKNWFKGINSELKKVVWPDKKRLKQNTGAVLAIIVVSALIIFVFDWLVGLLLNATGFYDLNADAQLKPANEIVSEIEDEEEDAEEEEAEEDEDAKEEEPAEEEDEETSSDEEGN